MQLIHILVLIALLTITINDAFPHASLSSFDNDPAKSVDDLNIVRREEYDPYGFNSILSRFYKRSKLDDIDKQNDLSPIELSFV